MQIYTMSTFNTKPTQPFLATTFLTFFLLLLINKVESSDDLSFNFKNKFVKGKNDLVLQGDASISSAGILQLTKVENGEATPLSIGRARYAAPVRIWDKVTGSVASFTTSFSFVVKAPTSANSAADGLTFFLAPPDSQFPSGSPGGFLGLFNDADYNRSNQIVAIEFDTFSNQEFNPWDPSFKHIGIDVNTIKSKKTVRWDWKNGEVAVVFINYLAPTKSLTISLTYPSDRKAYVLTDSVDLKAILPEWVRVGFSAATGPTDYETHDVLSWYFTSTLEVNK